MSTNPLQQETKRQYYLPCLWPTFFYKTCGEALPRKFPRITKYHYFKFSDTGDVICRTSLDDLDPKLVQLFENPASLLVTLPEQLLPAGLSSQRKAYLYESIRQYVPNHARDILCPAPEKNVEPGKQMNPISSENSIEPGIQERLTILELEDRINDNYMVAAPTEILSTKSEILDQTSKVVPKR